MFLGNLLVKDFDKQCDRSTAATCYVSHLLSSICNPQSTFQAEEDPESKNKRVRKRNKEVANQLEVETINSRLERHYPIRQSDIVSPILQMKLPTKNYKSQHTRNFFSWHVHQRLKIQHHDNILESES